MQDDEAYTLVLRDPLPGADALYTAAATRAFDRRAIERHGLPGIVLMRRAGAAAFEFLRDRWPDAEVLTICCGRGNNAGDGYVVAGMALDRGLQVQLLQVGDAADLKGDAARARDWALERGAQIEPFDAAASLRGDIVVDALLGTGIAGAVRPAFADAISAITDSRRPVLALDLPSGLDADAGCVRGIAVCADATITFIAAKRGLLTGAGPDHAGDLALADLGVPYEVFEEGEADAATKLLRLGEIPCRLPRRSRTAHKGAFGHTLIVGGDHGFGGAAVLAAEAAVRAGAGLVSVATRGAHLAPLLARVPEAMAHAVDTRAEALALAEVASVIVVGPGLGRAPWGEQMLDAVLAADRPVVADADALNLLAASDRRLPEGSVITPHPGEAARLLGTSTQAVGVDRFDAVAALAASAGAIAVLKGAGTLIAGRAEDGIALCPYGNPGMASGGMGDVLSGVVGALLAQGMEARAAAALAACVHGAAGDLAALETGEPGLRASDLAPHIGPLLAAAG
ncbi:MAG: NAD(P)H-hydrate dehydratase [Pseudomonadota bacterium]|nr:NAD(P)H-hydrate dehydratase [Pseudomonadota bacterium]